MGGVDGGGVAESGRGLNVVGGESDGEVAAVVPDCEVAAPADAGDGPAVAVFDPVGGGESEAAVVAAGDDHVSDAGPVPVGQRHLTCRRGVIEPMRAGPAVEFGDQVPGGCDHDRVESSSPVGNPSVERIFSCGGQVADMNTAVIKVEVEPRSIAVAEGERCCRFGRVGEAVQLGEAEGAVGVGDVAEDAAGADRGKLLIITDQADTCTASDGELQRGVEGQGVGHAGFVDDQQGSTAQPLPPIGQFTVPQRPGEFGEGVGADAGLLGKNSGCGSRRGHAEHLATVLGPGQGDGTHGGRFSGAGRGDRELQPGARRAHLPDQEGLPSIEGSSVRRHL